MPYVYRAGAKDVHRAWQAPGSPRAWSDDPCQFDTGGEWSRGIPAGSRCGVCFGRDLAARGDRSPDRRAARAVPMATGAGVAAIALMLAMRFDSPAVPVVAVSSSQPSSGIISPLASALLPAMPSPTPGNQGFEPTAAPAPTPEPTSAERIIRLEISTIVTRTFSIIRSGPAPSSKPCIHPGNHYGTTRCIR